MSLLIASVFSAGALLLGISACVTDATLLRARTAADCEKVQTCAVSGALEMSNDGHAYIGILRLDDGSCINVSLPENRSKELAGKAPQVANLTGQVFYFPFVEGALEFTVNGRKVGYGKCRLYFLYVK